MVKFKPKFPPKFNKAVFLEALTAAANEVAEDMESDFALTTRSWEHEPEWVRVIQISAREIRVAVGTFDEIYGFVTRGTKPHLISVVNAGALAFSSGFTPKTQPKVIGSGSGGSSGGVVFTPVVFHPGTQARGFEETLDKRYRKILPRIYQQALEEAAARSGHGAGR